MKKIYMLALLFSITLFSQPHWQELTAVPTNINNQRFDDIFFLNDNLGWAANGAYAAIYKTTDGGITWNLQLSEYTQALEGNHYFRSVQFLNENIGFVGTLNNKFLKTIDGGQNWTILPDFGDNPQSVCGIEAIGSSTVYGFGAYFTPAFMVKSTDSGETWLYTDMSAYANALVETLFVDENTGYAAGNDDQGGVILKTTDGGQTWNAIYHSGVPGEYVWKLQVLFSNPNAIFGSVEGVADQPGKLIRSLDNGVNWETHDTPETITQAVGFVSETHGWVGGHTTGFQETIDGGATWTDSGVGNNLNRIFIINDHLAYGAGASLYKFTDEQLGTTSNTNLSRTPLKAVIEPNPVKEKLNIKIEFIESDHLRMELFDATGRLVKELRRADIKAASTQYYTYDFPYSAGVYYLSIHTNTGKQSLKFVK